MRSLNEMVFQIIPTGIQQLIPKNTKTAVLTQIERITQPVTDFIRGNPIVSTAAVGIGTTGLIAAATTVVRKKRKRKVTAKRKVTRKRKKKTKAQIKAQRLRNLAKARRARKKGKRKIIRGRGLGTKEIKHSGKSTKGKFKLVQFRDKRTGKMVRFKARK